MQRTNTAPAYLKDVTPDIYTKKYGAIRTVSQVVAIVRNHPSLAVLRRNFGEDKIRSIIGLYNIELLDILGMSDKLIPKQSEFIISEILTDFYHLTMIDIALVYNQAARGEYGKIFNLSPPQVLGWFRQYDDQRSLEFATHDEKTFYVSTPQTQIREGKNFDKLYNNKKLPK